MTAISRSHLWYLFDYGMVVSTAPKPSDWQTLEHTTGLDLKPTTSPYWASRESFDSGELSPEEYWGTVLSRPVTSADIQTLEAHDLAQWSHLNSRTLAVLDTLQDENANVALLSNMPIQMAQRHLAESSWIHYFSKLYFSGLLRMSKPDAQIFHHVVADLGARPHDVVFIDDNAANVATARSLGFRTILHTSATDLREELRTVSG
jgi:putative hydrolase of the HAD superfamily